MCQKSLLLNSSARSHQQFHEFLLHRRFKKRFFCPKVTNCKVLNKKQAIAGEDVVVKIDFSDSQLATYLTLPRNLCK